MRTPRPSRCSGFSIRQEELEPETRRIHQARGTSEYSYLIGELPALRENHGPEADVVVEGEAVQVTVQAQLERLVAAWANKWDGRWKDAAREGAFHHDGNTALVLSVQPDKVFALAKSTFGQMRHRV